MMRLRSRMPRDRPLHRRRALVRRSVCIDVCRAASRVDGGKHHSWRRDEQGLAGRPGGLFRHRETSYAHAGRGGSDRLVRRTVRPRRGGFLAVSGLEIPAPDQRLYASDKIARLLTAARDEASQQGVAGTHRTSSPKNRPWRPLWRAQRPEAQSWCRMTHRWRGRLAPRLGNRSLGGTVSWRW